MLDVQQKGSALDRSPKICIRKQGRSQNLINFTHTQENIENFIYFPFQNRGYS